MSLKILTLSEVMSPGGLGGNCITTGPLAIGGLGRCLNSSAGRLNSRRDRQGVVCGSSAAGDSGGYIAAAGGGGGFAAGSGRCSEGLLLVAGFFWWWDNECIHLHP